MRRRVVVAVLAGSVAATGLAAFAVDRAQRPPGRRSFVASAAVAAAVTPTALAAWVVGDLSGFPHLGAAGGLLAGGLACAVVSARLRPSATAAVAR